MVSLRYGRHDAKPGSPTLARSLSWTPRHQRASQGHSGKGVHFAVRKEALVDTQSSEAIGWLQSQLPFATSWQAKIRTLSNSGLRLVNTDPWVIRHSHVHPEVWSSSLCSEINDFYSQYLQNAVFHFIFLALMSGKLHSSSNSSGCLIISNSCFAYRWEK